MTDKSRPSIPLAPDRTAVLARISLLLATHDGRAARLLAQPPGSRPWGPAPTAAAADDDDDDATLPANAAGLGYLPDPSASRTPSALERALLGRDAKRRRTVDAVDFRSVASSSDEDVGRSGLGRRRGGNTRPAGRESELPSSQLLKKSKKRKKEEQAKSRDSAPSAS